MALAYQHVPNTIETILDSRTVTPQQVLDLRARVWHDGVVNRREAELLFEINDTLESICGEWRDFFAEVMIAYLIEQAEPRGYISTEDAAWFQERLLLDGQVKGETELETLIQLLEKAVHVPSSLVLLAMNAVREAVLELDIFGTDTPMEEVYRRRLEREDAERVKAERVAVEEADWLIKRITRDGALNTNEAALLHFLRASGLPLDPSLDPLMARI